MKLIKVITLTCSALLIALSGSVFLMSDANAADARNFNAGRIIDDSVFTNKGAMSVQDIQNFFNSKVSCDTWGQKQSELGGGTRAQWMNARGIYAPFRCVTDYKENPATGQNNYGKNETPPGAISAAQIIYNYSQQFDINPQVLIVTLQKENGMITDEWPTPKQFSEAMGFGCPDNVAPGAPACDPQYGSFATQIYQAARHFRGYINNQAGWWVPFNTGWNSIAWSPTTSCGRGDVYIENRATVALYSYTPYQPNQAAKNAQYGHGDGCSAYGNRNFYLYFTDWFGSTNADIAITTPLYVEGSRPNGFYTKTPVKVSFAVTNNRNWNIGIGGMSVSVRDSQGRNLDFPLQYMNVPPRSTIHYESTQVLPREETYTFSIVNLSGGTWRSDYPTSSTVGHARTVTTAVREMPTQTSSITFGESDLRVNRDVSVGFTIRNNSGSSMNMGRLSIGVRGPNGENFDLPSVSPTLSSGQSYTYQQTFRAPYPGDYRFFNVATLDNGSTWDFNFPQPAGAAIETNGTVRVKEGVVMSQSIQSSLATPRSGQQSNLTFKVRNYGSTSVDLGKIGLMGRGPNGQNVDPGVVPVVLAAGEEKTLSFSVPFSNPGNYTYSVLSTANSGASWSNGPAVDGPAVSKNLSVNVGQGQVVSEGVSISPAVLHAGQQGSLSYKVKNYGTSAVDLGKLGLMGRGPNGQNVDPGVVPVVLAAGEEKTLSFNFTAPSEGQYNFGILQTTNSGQTWTSGPERDLQSINKDLRLDVKPVATMIVGLAASGTSLSVGQQVTLSYTVKNYGSSSVDLGKLGLMGRGPNGQNVDPGVVPVVLAAGEEKVISFSFALGSRGQYNFGLLGKTGSVWNDGITSESDDLKRNITLTVN